MQPPLSKPAQCQAYNRITVFKQGLSPSLKPTVNKGVISIHFLPVGYEHLVQRPTSLQLTPLHQDFTVVSQLSYMLLSVGKETDSNHKAIDMTVAQS
jgi:hypothetical protein